MGFLLTASKLSTSSKLQAPGAPGSRASRLGPATRPGRLLRAGGSAGEAGGEAAAGDGAAGGEAEGAGGHSLGGLGGRRDQVPISRCFKAPGTSCCLG